MSYDRTNEDYEARVASDAAAGLQYVRRATCKEIHENHRAAVAELHAEFQANINAAAASEFPDGAFVAWRMPCCKEDTTGVVTGRVAGETAAVMVRSDGGVASIVRAWELRACK